MRGSARARAGSSARGSSGSEDFTNQGKRKESRIMAKSGTGKKAGGEGTSSTETVAPKEFVADEALVTDAPAAADPAAEQQRAGKDVRPETATSRMIAQWRRNSRVYKAVRSLYERRGGREA